MKKVVFSILLILIFSPLNVKAYEKEIVTLNKCVDGDTASFIYNDEIIKVRFLAIDTPESVHPTKNAEAYGKTASEFTCNILTNANKIELEFDSKSSKTDKYGRYLAWIWTDDTLLQDSLINEGLAEVAYLYGDYKYTQLLQEHQTIAQSKKIGIWSEDVLDNSNTDGDSSNYLSKNNIYILIGSSIIIIIYCIISKSFRKKTINKFKKSIIKSIKK